MNHETKTTSTYNREKWLDTALNKMLEQCRSKFSLESLINAMPVTKGSFYTHFENRADFLLALVDFWHQRYTKTVIEKLENLPAEMSAADRLWELTRDIYDRNLNRFELIIRSLSLEFPEIRASIGEVDNNRLKTMESLFFDIGFEGDDLKARALMYITLISQDQNVFTTLSDEDWQRHLRFRHEFFTRR